MGTHFKAGAEGYQRPLYGAMFQIERCQGQVKGQGGGGLEGLPLIGTLDCKHCYQISCFLVDCKAI